MVLLEIDEINKRILNRLKEIEEELKYLPNYVNDAEKNKSKAAQRFLRRYTGNDLLEKTKWFEKNHCPEKFARNSEKILKKEKKDLILLKNKLVNSRNCVADFVYFLLTHTYYNTSRETYLFDDKKVKYQGRVRYFMTHDVADRCEGVTMTDDMAKEVFFPCKCPKNK